MTIKDQTPRPRRIVQAYADTNGVPPAEHGGLVREVDKSTRPPSPEAMQAAGTAAHSAPTWAADSSTDVKHERGEGVHLDDACTWFTRQLAAWA
ncbi:MAG: hypothetical protein ACR2FV_15680, partial [Ornithinimicrobium sp.]|uniref:hypothetical protein n=1 Tax=Ornithinimicrobium sp. TaxID=1977084 RepID=UPI003D9B7FD9